MIIEKGLGILTPIYGLHLGMERVRRSPDFKGGIPSSTETPIFTQTPKNSILNDNNKDKINPYTYLSFGIGPRNCISSRLALLEIKVLIIHLLRKFEIIAVKKTEIPLKLCPKNPFLGPDGFWLGLKKKVMI
nr:cytochrome P450 9e2-like [Onthophagus taurus]